MKGGTGAGVSAHGLASPQPTLFGRACPIGGPERRGRWLRACFKGSPLPPDRPAGHAPGHRLAIRLKTSTSCYERIAYVMPRMGAMVGGLPSFLTDRQRSSCLICCAWAELFESANRYHAARVRGRDLHGWAIKPPSCRRSVRRPAGDKVFVMGHPIRNTSMRMTRWAKGRRMGAGARDGGAAMTARQGGTDRGCRARLRVFADDSRSGRCGCRPRGGVALPTQWERA
jgi:hypothetical protein